VGYGFAPPSYCATRRGQRKTLHRPWTEVSTRVSNDTGDTFFGRGELTDETRYQVRKAQRRKGKVLLLRRDSAYSRSSARSGLLGVVENQPFSWSLGAW
jgi:hypothetical protein